MTKLSAEISPLRPRNLAMGNTHGVTMQRLLGVLGAAMLASMSGADAAANAYDFRAERVAPFDVSALLAAANGAPPVICALAAQSVRNYGWNDWTDAPYTPLAN